MRVRNLRTRCRIVWGGVLALGLLVPLWVRPAGAIEITEVQAINDATLLDGDGDTPDWIELYNPSPEAVALGGWYLTDSARDLTRWRFPDGAEIPGRGFLVVFASGKENICPNEEVHAGFRLDGDGGFLALVAPDGRTIVASLADGYPEQVPDTSFGLAMETSRNVLLATGAEARYLVPQDDSLGLDWTRPDFDDSSWASGATGLGFDRKRNPTLLDEITTNIQEAMDRVNSTVYIRIAFEAPDPSSIDQLVLRMKYDDGFVAYLNGVEVARRNIVVDPEWNSRAVRSHPDRAAVVFEDIDLGAAKEALQAGGNVLAVHGLNLSRSSSDFLILPELVAVRVERVVEGDYRFFETPTPGAPNAGDGLPAAVPQPLVSHPSGSYAGTLTVEVIPRAAGATVRYTLDGREPTEESELYEGPVVIESSVLFRARAYAPGMLPSRTVSRNYVVLHSGLADFDSNLPLLIVNTHGQGITENWTRLPITFAAFEVGEDGRARLTDPPQFIGNAAIKLRGSSSLGFPKKSYSLELHDENGRDMDASLLGLPEEEDWVLYGPYSDKSLMRNVLAYEWSNRIGRYAPRTRFVEMYLNTSRGPVTSAHYFGVYVLTEKIKRDPNRVDVERLPRCVDSEPEITGGYIIKKDRLDPGDSGFRTSRGQVLAFVYPKERNISTAQRQYIQGYYNLFERALYGAAFRDPEVGYKAYIDIDSWIDHHILTELLKNIDGFRLSTFMYKPRGGKLFAGPLWDFNLSLGNANYLQGWVPTGWYYTQLSENDYPWWRRIFQDPEFMARYRERWGELRSGPFRMAELMATIDGYVELLEEAQARNFQRWRVLGTYVWPNQFIARTWMDEINWMKDWLRQRVLWFDEQMLEAPRISSDSEQGTRFSSRVLVTIESEVGEVYYTLDETDPRGEDLEPSPTAIRYTGPFELTKSTRVRARARAGEAWSRMRQATFRAQLDGLVVSEFLFAPQPPPAGSPYSADDFEFIELHNAGSDGLDLSGLALRRAVEFEFPRDPPFFLEPGGYVLVVANREAFESRWPLAARTARIAGEFTGSLPDTFAEIELEGAVGDTVVRFQYQASWYEEAAAGGHSLVLVDPPPERDAWGDAASWRPSLAPGGSPGGPDAETPSGLQRPSDLSQDGRVDISDAMVLLGHLFLGTPSSLPCGGGGLDDEGNRTLADADGDGRVNVTDAVHVLFYLFRGGAPPALGEDCVPIRGCPDAPCAAP